MEERRQRKHRVKGGRKETSKEFNTKKVSEKERKGGERIKKGRQREDQKRERERYSDPSCLTFFSERVTGVSSGWGEREG